MQTGVKPLRECKVQLRFASMTAIHIKAFPLGVEIATFRNPNRPNDRQRSENTAFCNPSSEPKIVRLQ